MNKAFTLSLFVAISAANDEKVYPFGDVTKLDERPYLFPGEPMDGF